jgi:transcriptional regulator with XRE-family HTH domain
MANLERELNPSLSAAHRFGYELRRLRKARFFSQDRLAATVHVSGDLVHKVEIAERRPHIDFAERCDRALNANGALVQLWHAIEQERKCKCSCHRFTAIVQELRQPTFEHIT